MPEVEYPDGVRRIFSVTRVVAVLGAHPERHRPAFYVPDYLFTNGYRLLPINPTQVGRVLWHQPVQASLLDVDEPVEVVNIFRRSEALMGHLDEILSMQPLPKVVWVQLGIRDDLFGERLMAAGVDVVQDRCMLADHRRLGLKPRED